MKLNQLFPLKLFLVSVIGIVAPICKEEKSPMVVMTHPCVQEKCKSWEETECERRDETKGKEERKTQGNGWV